MSRTVKAYPIIAPRDRKERQQLVQRTAVQLAEHFDSVVIICSHHNGQTTTRYDYRAGNCFAANHSVFQVANILQAEEPVAPDEDDDD